MSVAPPTRPESTPDALSGTPVARRDLLNLGRTRRHLGRGPVSGHWIRVHRAAMACRFEVTLAGEDRRHVAAAHEALAEADRIEAAWTVFRDTSVLADVNRRACDEAVAIDPELFALLVRCRDLHAAAEGAFDITSAPLSRCWGFLAREGRLPAPEAIETARALIGMDGVTLDEVDRTVRFRRPGMSLNLGSIGKGYAVGAIAHRLRTAGVRHALVSAGASSIVALGGRGRGWAIDVSSRQRARQTGRGPLARIWLRDGAMATSGAGEQFFEVDGRRYGHLIDPRTGWPAPGLLSVTVIAADGATADALATAFFVGGADLARRYCAAHPDILVLVTADEADARTEPIGGSRRARVEIETEDGWRLC
jgi:FAD:protein FMN transferase